MDTSVPDPWDGGLVNPGSTDVSDASWITPTKEFSTATWPLGTPGHSWMNVAASAHSISHKSLIIASKVIASAGLDLLTDAELRKRAWEEHGKRTMGKEYNTPIPKWMEPPLDIWGKK